MSTDGSTDDAMVVPQAKPLTGEAVDPDQPDPSDVMPGGKAREVEHLVRPEEQGPAQS